MVKSLVIDTNILIYLSKGIIDFDTISRNYDNLYISAISYMEAMGYEFKNKDEQELLQEFLKSIKIVETDLEISDIVISYRSKSKIKLPDAIILATAKKLKSDLITADVSDFKKIDPNIKIINPLQVK